MIRNSWHFCGWKDISHCRSQQTWGQFNSGIGIDGQFQFQFRNWNWNWNCLFEKIIELELKILELELELKFATKNLNPQIIYTI